MNRRRVVRGTIAVPLIGWCLVWRAALGAQSSLVTDTTGSRHTFDLSAPLNAFLPHRRPRETFMAGTGAAAQVATGTISGRVVDSEGGVLQGATLTLEPGGSSVASDSRGEFTITNLAPSQYFITASYAGFSPFARTVVVVAGETAHIDAMLNVDSTRELVVVRADQARPDVQAIQRQRTADNILQALPSEVIKSLPNPNVADAIGRLSGVGLHRDAGEGTYVQIRGTEPRLANVTIDGINVPSPEGTVRDVRLDVIPADLVGSVEISKTLSASQDADGIGGSVNLRTKTAGSRPTVAMSGMGGITPLQGGRGVSQFSGTVGRRFGAEQRLGVLVGASYDYNGRGIDDIEASPASIQNGRTASPAYTSLDLRSYVYNRTRSGFSGSVDYRIDDHSSVYLRGLYSDLRNFWDKSAYTLSDTVAADGTIIGAAPKYLIAGFRPRFAIGNLVGGGQHVVRGSLLSWDASSSSSRATDSATNPKGDFKAVGNLKTLATCASDPSATANPFRPQFSAGCLLAGSSVFDASQYTLKDIVTTSGQSVQLNLQASASVQTPYRLGSHAGAFVIGGKIRNAHKSQDVAINTFLPVDGTLPLSSFVSTHTDSQYYGGSYTQGPFGDYDKLTAYFNANPGAFTQDYNATRSKTDANNYDLVEHVSAGYLMNTTEFGRLRVQAGLRVETTQLDVLGYHVTVNAKGDYVSTTPVRTPASYVDALPSLQMRYALDADTDVRVVYGRGLSRPNPYDLVPYVNESTQALTLTVGNPQLKPEHADSYDLLFERYLKRAGLIQAGFFYKSLYNPIYQFATVVTDGPYVNYIQNQLANGSNAHLTGAELAYQQRLGFLPGVLQGISISANYTHTSSRAGSLPGRSDNPALPRQASNLWNVGPGYDRGALSLHLGLSYNGPNISAYQYKDRAIDGTPLKSLPIGGLQGPSGDKYYYAHLQVDAQGDVHLGRGLTAVMYGRNLTNEVFGYYNGSPIYVSQREFYGREFGGGFRWLLGR